MSTRAHCPPANLDAVSLRVRAGTGKATQGIAADLHVLHGVTGDRIRFWARRSIADVVHVRAGGRRRNPVRRSMRAIRREALGPVVGPCFVSEKIFPRSRKTHAIVNQRVCSLRNGISGPRSRIVLIVQRYAANCACDRTDIVVAKPAVQIVEANHLPTPNPRRR